MYVKMYHIYSCSCMCVCIYIHRQPIKLYYNKTHSLQHFVAPVSNMTKLQEQRSVVMNEFSVIKLYRPLIDGILSVVTI